jgi:hypothetical protein
MVVADSDFTIPLIDSHLKRENNLNVDPDDIDLLSWIGTVKAAHPEKKITLLLYDMEKYFRFVHYVDIKQNKIHILKLFCKSLYITY